MEVFASVIFLQSVLVYATGEFTLLTWGWRPWHLDWFVSLMSEVVFRSPLHLHLRRSSVPRWVPMFSFSPCWCGYHKSLPRGWAVGNTYLFSNRDSVNICLQGRRLLQLLDLPHGQIGQPERRVLSYRFLGNSLQYSEVLSSVMGSCLYTVTLPRHSPVPCCDHVRSSLYGCSWLSHWVKLHYKANKYFLLQQDI